MALMTEPAEARRALRELLVDMFPARQLEMFVHDFAPQLVPAIAWGRSHVDVAFQLTGLLRDHGLIGQDLFAALAGERPVRADEIAVVARMFGLVPGAAPTSSTPANRRLVCVAAPVDSSAFSQLVSHTSPLVQNGLLTVMPVFAADELRGALATADIVVVLLSLELLNSELGRRMADELERLPPQAVYLGAVLRACLWQSTAFGRRRMAFPQPLEEHASSWADLARRIGDVLGVPASASAEALVEQPGTSPSLISTVLGPPEATSIRRIFSPSGVPVYTLVETPQIRVLIEEMSFGASVIVLEGPSGTGKTSAARAALERVHGERRTWGHRYLHCKVDGDRTRLANLLDGPVDARLGFVFVDDFHELDGELKRRLGRYAKATIDLPHPSTIFLLVGINGLGASLIGDVRDLGGGRARVIEFGRQAPAIVLEMIGRGEAAANVELTRKPEIADEAGGSLMLAQLLCKSLLEANGVDAVPAARRIISTSVIEICDRLHAQLRNDFHAPLQAFANLDRGAPSRGAGIATLWELSRSDTASISFADTRGHFSDVDAAFDTLLDALDAPGTWRELLFCGHRNNDRRCAFSDPRLEFYLRHLDWEAFARDCGVRITVSAEQGPIFLAAIRPVATPTVAVIPGPEALVAAPTDSIRILHLSDFHFRAGTSWDSSTVLGRLSRDIGELRQDGWRPDLIVVTGDVAQSGRPEEYELATKWLRDDLLGVAELGPERLAIVPGNHDVDRAAVKLAARSLQTALLTERKQAEVAAVLAGAERAILVDRHRAYVDFVRNLGGIGREWEVPWGVQRLRIRDTSVRVAAFCSSFMAHDDSDHGRLLLGLWQSNLLLAGAEDDDLVVAAMHHPWSYFAEFDDPAHVEIRRGSDLVLRGHLHNARTEQVAGYPHGVGGAAVEIAAGASYESSERPNSYFALDVDLAARKVRLHARLWNPNSRKWQRDRNLFDRDVGEMPLPARPR